MMIEPCLSNQWSRDLLMASVDDTVSFLMTTALVSGRGTIDPKKLREDVLRNWLAAAAPAGNA